MAFSDNVGRYDMKSGQWRPATADEQAATVRQRQIDNAASKRQFFKQAALSAGAVVGGAFVGPALGAMGGGSAAGGTLGSMAGTIHGGVISTAAPTFSGLAGGSMGVPWWKLGELAVGTFGNIYGANKSQSANRESLRAQMAGQTQAEILAREQMAEEKRQFELTRQEQAAQWAADQKFQADKFAASEEERLYDRRLKDEREARMGPYREASAAALQRLPGLIASGRQTPGMGSLKWMAGK